MSINKDTIKKISKLARISVTNEETDRLEKDLNSILIAQPTQKHL